MKVFSCGYLLPHSGLSLPADHLQDLLLPPKPVSALKHQERRHKDTNGYEHSTSANPLVHIRYTVFLSCFSSAFPNGWLNQLCGAWFKSSGMLGSCQRLDGTAGRKQSYWRRAALCRPAFIKICFCWDESYVNRANQVGPRVKTFKLTAQKHQIC